jgi:hypothetical protein
VYEKNFHGNARHNVQNELSWKRKALRDVRTWDPCVFRDQNRELLRPHGYYYRLCHRIGLYNQLLIGKIMKTCMSPKGSLLLELKRRAETVEDVDATFYWNLRPPALLCKIFLSVFYVKCFRERDGRLIKHCFLNLNTLWGLIFITTYFTLDRYTEIYCWCQIIISIDILRGLMTVPLCLYYDQFLPKLTRLERCNPYWNSTHSIHMRSLQILNSECS